MENLTVEQRALLKLAIDKVIEQGCKSGGYDEDSDYQCLYRGPNGTKCAVGHLIADEFYTPELEQLSVRTDELKDVLRASNPNVLIDHLVIDLLSEVQYCHDSAQLFDFVNSFKEKVNCHGLNAL